MILQKIESPGRTLPSSLAMSSPLWDSQPGESIKYINGERMNKSKCHFPILPFHLGLDDGIGIGIAENSYSNTRLCLSDTLTRNISLNPKRLGFRPINKWNSWDVDLENLISVYFRARSTKKLRFEHKLWNALAITKAYPDLKKVIGVEWLSESIIKVYRDAFASLINVSRPTSALFNVQGSFSSHGFREISVNEARQTIHFSDLKDVDESKIRLFVHTSGAFTDNIDEKDMEICKWKNVSI